MSDSFSELQKALIDVISGLKSMSIDILKKSDIYLQKVECLDLNCAEPVTQSIKMLVERMSNNLTQFGVVLDDAFNSYKKIQGSEEPFVSSEVVTGIKPCSTNKCLTKMDTEDEISLEPVTFSTEALIKQEDCHGEIECDEPTLQNVDFPVVSIFKDSAVDQEYLTSETKNESKKFETGNQMIVELKKENQFEDFCTDNLKTDLSDEIEEAEQLNSPLLPEKSRNRYENQLKDFNEWRQKNAASTVLNETVLLEYVSSLSKKFKASSVWTKFSMLKKAFIVTGEIDISRFGKVMAFMKNQKVNYGPKKFKILSVEQCRKFLLEAPDDFLLCKVVLIFGLYGACRQEELVKLTVDDIEDHQKYLIVNLTTNTSRSFIVPDASGTLNPYNIYQQYSRLRPSHVGTRRFFLGYQRGKCVAQPAGMHTIGGVPRKVATFLGLDHPESYTGHCLRRSGVSMAAEGYIERPIRSKIDDNENEVAENIDIEDYEHLFPLKSKQRYKNVYKVFVKWLKTKNEVISERSLLSYFLVRSSTLKAPSSLWPEYSMLKSTIKMQHGIDISKFNKLIAFLKKKNVGYIPKKSKTFTKEEIDKFLKEAPDDFYLVMKVVMIMGIAGACRRVELAQMTRDCVNDCGTHILITVPGTKTSVPRTFTITNRFSERNNYVEIFRKYLNLLPPHLPSSRLFLSFRNGKCSIQGLGVNRIGKIPARIARFLRLPDPDSYTGLAFRRSASLLANAGVDIITVRHGELSYSTVPDNFVWYSREDTDPLAIASTSEFSGGPTG